MEPTELTERVASALSGRDPGHPLRVGIDGVCGAGKSTFARVLADVLTRGPRPVIRIDSDGFHNVRAVRYRQGRESAGGYYEDAYDFDSLRRLTLEPLGPGGSGRYAHHVHDLHTDEVDPRWADAAPDAIVIFDATFLQRDDLRELWDEVIYLDVAREQAVKRGVKRDSVLLGGAEAARAAYEVRYMAACDIYRAEQAPRERATIVVDNTDVARPVLRTSL
ncbi:nucleoside/nucleotide kinase family protein [Microbacterium gorillae]|uniref:uridine kinase n=1 Tax=Microbacterium gorillae TaxID=1231063 RepID=UPI000A611A0E|nr:uridine kinase [Microbacterium gorillae]